jgi:hypothetical protein
MEDKDVAADPHFSPARMVFYSWVAAANAERLLALYRQGTVTLGSSAPLHRAFDPPEAGFDYFATEVHYRSLAGRIITVLGGFNVVVVTGDPAASARLLSTALSEAAASRYTVIDFSCGSELGRRVPLRFRHALSTSLAGDGAKGEELGSSAAEALLVVFDDADRLSDEAIEEIFKNIYLRTSFDHRRIAAAVLLARPDFLARLERPALRFWLAKRLLVARLRFLELDDDEILAFIRRQLRSHQGESAFTHETVTAIANVSGGDPMVVNRFSRRLLEFAAATSGGRPAQDALVPAAVVPAEMPREERGIAILDQPSTRTRRGSGMVLKLSAGAMFCLACVGVMTVVLLLLPAKQKIAASGIPVTEAAVILPEDGSSPGDRGPSGAGVTAGTALAPSLSPEEPAGYPAEPAPTAASAPTRAGRQEAAAPVATPSPEATPQARMPTTAEVLGSGNPEANPVAPTPIPITPTPPPRLSAAEIVTLVARGDRFFAQRDIASARLFYERAADAGDGQSALKLAKTFDPLFLYFAHLNTVRGDAGTAAYWYRRARDLREAEAR